MGQSLEKVDKPRYIEADGLIVPSSFSRQNVEYAIKMRPDDGDIVIAGYPNSGTKTMAIMLYLLAHARKKSGNMVSVDIPLLEWSGQEVEHLPRPRIMCTHLPYFKLNINPQAKYICTVRNPKDCCAHGFEDAITFALDYDYPDGRFDDFLDLFLKGLVHGNDYYKHVMSWWTHRSESHVLTLVFEDLRMESRSYVERVVSFVGCRDITANSKNISLMQEVLENIGNGPAHSRVMEIKMATPSTDRPVARMSTAGYWKNYFTCGQSKRMDSIFMERTRGTDIRDLWNDYNVFAA